MPASTTAAGIYVRLDASDELSAGQRTEFTLGNPLTIGRDTACDIVLSAEDVPLQAAQVSADDGSVYLNPLAPVLVNGQPVQERQPLRSGDHITISGHTIRLLF